MVHGISVITPHSTAILSSVFKVVSTLLTVFGAFVRNALLRPWTSSVVMASSRFPPNRGIRCTRRIVSFAAIPLGLCWFARA